MKYLLLLLLTQTNVAIGYELPAAVGMTLDQAILRFDAPDIVDECRQGIEVGCTKIAHFGHHGLVFGGAKIAGVVVWFGDRSGPTLDAYARMLANFKKRPKSATPVKEDEYMAEYEWEVGDRALRLNVQHSVPMAGNVIKLPPEKYKVRGWSDLPTYMWFFYPPRSDRPAVAAVKAKPSTLAVGVDRPLVHRSTRIGFPVYNPANAAPTD